MGLPRWLYAQSQWWLDRTGCQVRMLRIRPCMEGCGGVLIWGLAHGPTLQLIASLRTCVVLWCDPTQHGPDNGQVDSDVASVHDQIGCDAFRSRLGRVGFDRRAAFGAQTTERAWMSSV